MQDPSHGYRANGYWTDCLLTDYFETAVSTCPDRVAVKDERFGSVSYGELASKTRRLAAALQSKGVTRGDRFVVALPNWHHVPAFVLALTYIGAVIVVMPVAGGEHEFKGVVKVSGAKGIVVPEEFHGQDFISLIDGLAGHCETLEVLVNVGSEEEHPGWVTFDRLLADAPAGGLEHTATVSASDLHCLLFTSGSSGDPKGVMHSSNTIGAMNTTVAPLMDLGPDDIVFSATPLGFSASFAHGLRLAIYLGATLVLQERWDADRALQTMARENVTFTLTTPTLLRDLLNSERFPEYGPQLSLRRMFCGGAYVPAALLREVREKLPQTFTTVIWGMTEGIGTACRPGTADERVTGSDGQPFLGTELKILGEDDKELPRGDEGDLVMRGPQLFLGYFGRPDLDEELFLQGGWFRTGDVATIDEDGFVKISGRRKELIIRGGANISPAEIEEVLRDEPKCRQLAIVGLPDERLGEQVCACVVKAPACRDLTLEELNVIARQKGLARYKWPEHLEFVSALPTTAAGKLRRSVLQAEVINRRQGRATARSATSGEA